MRSFLRFLPTSIKLTPGLCQPLLMSVRSLQMSPITFSGSISHNTFFSNSHNGHSMGTQFIARRYSASFRENGSGGDGGDGGDGGKKDRWGNHSYHEVGWVVAVALLSGILGYSWGKSNQKRKQKRKKEKEANSRAVCVLDSKKEEPKKNYEEQIEEAKIFMQGLLKGFEPEVGLVLGSGLGPLADEIEDAVVIPFSKIPNFPISTLGKLSDDNMVVVCGTLGGRKVITTKYRTHYYEGISMKEITFPIRLMVALGIKNLVLSNAAGGVTPDMDVGNLMLIRDHLNFSGDNPLIGPNVSGGKWACCGKDKFKRFPDSTNVYDKDIREKVREKAKKLDIKLKEGVYVMMSGPSYETPAEISMINTVGGHAVGMSTVPEALVASHSNVKVTAISMITNKAAGIIPGQKLDHKDVLATTEREMHTFKKLVREILELCTNEDEDECKDPDCIGSKKEICKEVDTKEEVAKEEKETKEEE